MKTGNLTIKLMIATHRNTNLNCIYRHQIDLLVRENITKSEANEITRTFIELNSFNPNDLEPRWYCEDEGTNYFDDDRGFHQIITKEEWMAVCQKLENNDQNHYTRN